MAPAHILLDGALIQAGNNNGVSSYIVGVGLNYVTQMGEVAAYLLYICCMATPAPVSTPHTVSTQAQPADSYKNVISEYTAPSEYTSSNEFTATHQRTH